MRRFPPPAWVVRDIQAGLGAHSVAGRAGAAGPTRCGTPRRRVAADSPRAPGASRRPAELPRFERQRRGGGEPAVSAHRFPERLAAEWAGPVRRLLATPLAPSLTAGRRAAPRDGRGRCVPTRPPVAWRSGGRRTVPLPQEDTIAPGRAERAAPGLRLGVVMPLRWFAPTSTAAEASRCRTGCAACWVRHPGKASTGTSSATRACGHH